MQTIVGNAIAAIIEFQNRLAHWIMGEN